MSAETIPSWVTEPTNAIECVDYSPGTVQPALPLDTLNPEQRAAVETTEGPVLVLAGAGTGKTRVLTTRIAHIIQQNLAFPGQIMAVTFTNKAAKEMQERITEMTGPLAGSLWLGTFHALGLRILRRHAEHVKLPSNFTIIDPDDQVRLLKDIIADSGADDKRYPAKSVAASIQRWKDRALTPEQAARESGDSTLSALYTTYQKRLQQLGVADFGDLLMLCIQLFTEQPGILAEYHRKLRYIHVDEYQDTNIAQYLWLRLLAQGSYNICCVGDDDQSIYGWRGAEVENILRFEDDFAKASPIPPTIIRLETNYRSTPHILNAASAVIAFNEGRLGKTLRTEISEGEKVRVVSLWDDRTEALFVGQQLEHTIHGGTSADDIAVLVRAGHQTRSFEEIFMQMSIPYKVIGGLRFYERLEIRDAIAYFRLAMQPGNDLAFLRVINTPKRGIGSGTLDKLRTYAVSHGLSLYEACSRLFSDTQDADSPKITGKICKALEDFCQHVGHWHSQSESLPHGELATLILEDSGYQAMWEKENTPEAKGRVDNLRELLRALEEFTSLEQFLEHVALVMDTDDSPDGEHVSIMTMHGAKGLEFDTVFLTGWEEGLFPSQRSMDENGQRGLEEERRLAYVGITRAKHHLTISFAANRRTYGQWMSSIPSRFIDELPQEAIEMENAYGPGGGQPAVSSAEKPSPIATTTPDDGSLRVGDRVFHQKFGYGHIKKTTGEHLTVVFEKTNEKTILAEYLQKV